MIQRMWKLCIAEFVRCLARFDVSLELCYWSCCWWPCRIYRCWCRSVNDCIIGIALHCLLLRSDEVIEILQILPPSRVVSLHLCELLLNLRNIERRVRSPMFAEVFSEASVFGFRLQFFDWVRLQKIDGDLNWSAHLHVSGPERLLC